MLVLISWISHPRILVIVEISFPESTYSLGPLITHKWPKIALFKWLMMQFWSFQRIRNSFVAFLINAGFKGSFISYGLRNKHSPRSKSIFSAHVHLPWAYGWKIGSKFDLAWNSFFELLILSSYFQHWLSLEQMNVNWLRIITWGLI